MGCPTAPAPRTCHGSRQRYKLIEILPHAKQCAQHLTYTSCSNLHSNLVRHRLCYKHFSKRKYGKMNAMNHFLFKTGKFKFLKAVIFVNFVTLIA